MNVSVFLYRQTGKQYSGYCKDGISCWPKTFSISFDGCFPSAPDVIAALTVIDSGSTTDVCVSAKAASVTNCGFDLKINPWGDSDPSGHLLRVGALGGRCTCGACFFLLDQRDTRQLKGKRCFLCELLVSRGAGFRVEDASDPVRSGRCQITTFTWENSHFYSVQLVQRSGGGGGGGGGGVHALRSVHCVNAFDYSFDSCDTTPGSSSCTLTPLSSSPVVFTTVSACMSLTAFPPRRHRLASTTRRRPLFSDFGKGPGDIPTWIVDKKTPSLEVITALDPLLSGTHFLYVDQTVTTSERNEETTPSFS